ncbi:MAG TPA: alpha-(1-_3)-arabinofuranosyltransferase family protein, partial [Acidimicrobiales bacterium]
MPTSEPAAPPTDRPALPAPTTGERRALWLATVALVGLCVGQAPGRIVPETKLDVVVAPAQFLGRALRAWDPLAAFGRLQNQAVGYLFPMGPFSLGGKAAGLPPWLTQRLWIASLLVAGLWGAHRVARVIGIGSAGGRVVAGLAYTISPATMAVVAFQSAGQVPYALAPWVLVPLLEADRFRSPRRAAALSGLAVAAMGGVNGTATLAVLPLAVLWFVTRRPGPERRRLAAWWVGSVVLAIAWWVAALAIFVRYGVRFTSYTETAATTTSTESVTEVLRGTGNWLGYLHSEGSQWLPGAWSMISSRVAIVGSSLVAALGVGGLARSDAPARRWLVPTAVLGAIAIGIGHQGTLGGGLAPQFQALLDGPLAPFRNVQKFAPVLRLPLALGLGHLVTVAAQRWPLARPGKGAMARAGRTPVVACGAVALVVLAILPAIPGHIPAPGSFTGIPRYWTDATHWLDRHDAGGGRALLEPGEPFGEYDWGRPLDEPLSEGKGDWAVRDLIPLGGDGSTRVLDALDLGLSADHVPAGFTPTLARMGVRYVVVRNDLDPKRRTGPGPAQIHRALSTAPTLRRVAAFGPEKTDAAVPRAARTGAGVANSWPAIEVFAVPSPSPRAVAYPVRGSIVASGGAEGIVQADPADLAGRAYVLDADVPAGTDLPGVVAGTTDTARRRDVTFGNVRTSGSYTLGAHEDAAGNTKSPQDRLGFPPDHHLTVATTVGAAELSASSFPEGTNSQPQSGPYAAFDGDPSTSWVPGEVPLASWVQVRFAAARHLGRVVVSVPTAGLARVDAVEVTTDDGSRSLAVPASGRATITLDRATTRLRVTITGSTKPWSVSGPAIADVTSRAISIFRPLVTPTDRPASIAHSAPEVAWLARIHGDPYASAGDEDIRLDRVVHLDQSGSRTISGTASALPGSALDRLLGRSSSSSADGGEAAATTTWGDIPALGPAAAIDGDPSTSWISALNDPDPAITVIWPEARTLDELRL